MKDSDQNNIVFSYQTQYSTIDLGQLEQIE